MGGAAGRLTLVRSDSWNRRRTRTGPRLRSLRRTSVRSKQCAAGAARGDSRALTGASRTGVCIAGGRAGKTLQTGRCVPGPTLRCLPPHAPFIQASPIGCPILSISPSASGAGSGPPWSLDALALSAVVTACAVGHFPVDCHRSLLWMFIFFWLHGLGDLYTPLEEQSASSAVRIHRVCPTHLRPVCAWVSRPPSRGRLSRAICVQRPRTTSGQTPGILSQTPSLRSGRSWCALRASCALVWHPEASGRDRAAAVVASVDPSIQAARVRGEVRTRRDWRLLHTGPARRSARLSSHSSTADTAAGAVDVACARAALTSWQAARA